MLAEDAALGVEDLGVCAAAVETEDAGEVEVWGGGGEDVEGHDGVRAVVGDCWLSSDEAEGKQVPRM